MIRIELVEDGYDRILYGYVDAIEEAMLREREAFEWALAREAMSPFSGFQSRLMDRLRRVVERRPKLCAALAVAGAVGLGYWLWSSSAPAADDEVPENARCPICMDRAVSAHKGAAFEVTFAAELCCVCGATTCAACAEGVMRHAEGEGRVPTCAMCRTRLIVTGAARHLRLRHLVEKRPTGPHVAQALYELGSMRARGDGCVGDATKAFKHLADAAKRGHARAALALAACFAEGKGCARNPNTSRHWLLTAARRGSTDASKIAAHVLKNGGTTAKCYGPWTKQDASVVEAVQKGPSAGLEDVAHDALSLAARIRDGLGLVANDARNGSRLATEIVNDLSSVGGDLRAARDAFRDYLNEAEAVHGDQAWEGTSAERREAILQVFQQVDSIIQQIQPQEAPAATRADTPDPRVAAGNAVVLAGGFSDGYWTVRWASGATEAITLRDGCFSVYGEDYEIQVAEGRYSFEWGDGTVQTLVAFDGRTITWATTNPANLCIFWDRREPTLMESVPRELPDDWEPPATVRMGAGGLEEVPREEESLLMRGEHVAHMLRTRSPRALALATQSNLDYDAVRAAENAIRAPTELRFGSPPPRPRAGDDDAAAEMARRFDRARALSEAEREELWSEADRRSDELERQAEEANRRFLAEAERRGRAAGRRTVVHASLVDAAETATAPAGDDGDAAGQWAQVSARFDELERQAEILAEAQRRDQATGQSDIEENARRWLETAGDDAAARASAFAEGGYLDPSDFAAASSSDSDSSEASSESSEDSDDASDSSGEGPLFGAVTAPRVEADL